jgi:hypothetical protein
MRKPNNRKTAYVEWKNKSGTSNKRGKETISKSSRKYLDNKPGKHDITELQKTAILGIRHLLKKVLILKYKTLVI